jgi:hypothetical protein
MKKPLKAKTAVEVIETVVDVVASVMKDPAAKQRHIDPVLLKRQKST